MQLKQADFIQAMKLALPGVEQNQSIIEGADTFVFNETGIHAYNDNISVSVPFITGLKGSVKAVDFFKLISKIPTPDLSIEAGEGSFQIVYGKNKAEMTNIVTTLSDYISTLKLETVTWKEIPTNFFEAVTLCKFGCNRTPQRGIFVTKDRMISTDVNRINCHQLTGQMDQFWLDDPAVSEISKLDKITYYSVSDSWLHLKNVAGAMFSCKLKDPSSYPLQRLEELIAEHQKGPEDLENTFPEGISTVVDRVAVLAADLDSLPAIKMTIRKDSVDFDSTRSSGKIHESLDLAKPFPSDPEIQLWVDPVFLLEAAKRVKGFYIKIVNNSKRIIFFNGQYIQIVATIAEK